MKRVGDKKQKRSNMGFLFLFLIGFALLSYPLSGQIISFYQSHQKIKTYEKAVSQLEPEIIQKKMALAQAYNASLVTAASSAVTYQDPFSEEMKNQGKAEYARMLEVKEQLGYMTIPKISQELPIYAGVSEDVLQKGIGHLEGSSLPVGGEFTHTVLTGHRGLPKARLFTDLDKLEKGDKIYLHILNQVLAYQIDDIVVVEPTDVSKIKIVEQKDYVTLITCTPYMINSHRLLVRGYRIPYSEKEEKVAVEKGRQVLWIIVISSVVLVLGLTFILFKKKRRK